MIDYTEKGCNLKFICGVRGSVIPQTMCWVIPSMAVAAVNRMLIDHYLKDSPLTDSVEGALNIWTSSTFVMGFLLVFRTQQAYSRYWEGSTLLQQIKGEWFNAVSSLFAFCTTEESLKKETQHFQHVVVRLMSMLHCTALQQIAVMDDENFEIIDNAGIDVESLRFLLEKPEQCEVILQWVQRLIVDHAESGVISIPAPILSRVFQELSRGIVNVNNARKITDTLWPFPYAQLTTILLMMHSCLTPFACSFMVNIWWAASILAGVAVLVFWGIHYIAIEIEMPFGDDLNDLPMAELQRSWNASLITLLEKKTQEPPKFVDLDVTILPKTIPWHQTASILDDEEDHRKTRPSMFGGSGSSLDMKHCKRQERKERAAAERALLRTKTDVLNSLDYKDNGDRMCIDISPSVSPRSISEVGSRDPSREKPLFEPRELGTPALPGETRAGIALDVASFSPQRADGREGVDSLSAGNLVVNPKGVTKSTKRSSSAIGPPKGGAPTLVTETSGTKPKPEKRSHSTHAREESPAVPTGSQRAPKGGAGSPSSRVPFQIPGREGESPDDLRDTGRPRSPDSCSILSEDIRALPGQPT